jgi:hypothetical protein
MEAGMKHLILALGIAALAGCTAEPPAQTAGDEAKLTTALAGYTQSGPPVSCVSQRDLGSSRSSGPSAIVFQSATSSRLWVNRPAGGCPSFDPQRILVTRTTGTQLCRGDIAGVMDPVSRTEFGSCVLGDFTPYTRNR